MAAPDPFQSYIGKIVNIAEFETLLMASDKEKFKGVFGQARRFLRNSFANIRMLSIVFYEKAGSEPLFFADKNAKETEQAEIKNLGFAPEVAYFEAASLLRMVRPVFGKSLASSFSAAIDRCANHAEKLQSKEIVSNSSYTVKPHFSKGLSVWAI